jgi:two-component system cell cycle response regulator DivK
MNRDMLSRRLQRRGFEVLIAADGEEGVSLASAQRPDLILMDMSLPVLDGWEATRRIKAAPDTRRIPIIGLTAHAMGRSGQVSRSGLRRLRHQAGRARTASGKNRASARHRAA